MYASKLMRGSGLSAPHRAQVLFNAGGVMDPVKLTEVLRLTHKDIQDHDDRKGKTYPLKLRVKKTYKTIKKRYRSTNVQDQDDDDAVMVDGTDEEDDDDEDVLVQDVEDEEGDENDDDAEADDTNDVNELDIETDSDNMSVDTEAAEVHFTSYKEAFQAGWKAKQKNECEKKSEKIH